MKVLFFLIFLLSELLIPGSSAHAFKKQELPESMKNLCKRVDVDFSPEIAILQSPSKDPLFMSIEIGGGYDDTKRILGNRDPESIFTLGDITPLMYSATLGNWQAAVVFLESGANPYYYSKSMSSDVLGMAVYNSQFSFACKLLEIGIELPKTKATKDSLMQSAIAMKADRASQGAIFIDYLLSRGFNVNDYGIEGDTPIISAIAMSNLPLIEVLLKHGANLDIHKEGARSAWGMARKKNNPHVLKLLKEAEAQKRKKPKKRQPTALVPATV